MKRKLIWQGNNSATMTLPIDWVRKQGLENGQEIEVVHSGEFLVVGSKTPKTKRRIELHFTENVGSAVKKVLTELYRCGYDEILINFQHREMELPIQDMAWHEMVGFELIKVKEGQTLLKNIAELDPEHFPVLFKKSFLLLMSLARELVHALRVKDKKSLEQMPLRDQEVNKTTNLCLRLLSKKMNDRKKITVLADVLRALEKMGDGFKDIAQNCLKRKEYPSQKTLADLELLNDKLQQIYILYSAFDLQKVLAVNQSLRDLNAKVGKEEDFLSRYFHSLVQKMETLNGGAIILNIEGEEVVKEEDWVQ